MRAPRPKGGGQDGPREISGLAGAKKPRADEGGTPEGRG